MFLLLIAQATPPAENLKAWLEVLFFLAGLTAAILCCFVYIKQLRAKDALPAPQPFEVRTAQQFQTVEQCHALHERMALDQRMLAERFDAELGRERGGRKELHGNITEIKADLAELRAESKALAESLYQAREDNRETRDRIDLLPQRLVEMLRNTKGLI